jgi:glutathione synthase/RimK-type ligase-like ATP-grasp enzyme
VILLWGVGGERPFEHVRAALGDLRQRPFVFDQRDVLRYSIETHVAEEATGRIVGPAGTLDLSDVTAVYARPYDPTGVPAVVEAGPRACEHARGVYDALRVWTEVSRALLVNRFSAMGSNNSKPYQIRLLRELGFRVPATLVTTDAAAVRGFAERHGDVIYKSVSGVRSIVSRLAAERLATLEDLGCPTQFQEYVAGTDVRVHAVGETAIACEIASNAVDYRYPGNAHVERTPLELPPDIAVRCCATAKALGLAIAGVDLRRTPEGEWCCFEVNPLPAFAYFDRDGSIARAIAGLLASGGAS